MKAFIGIFLATTTNSVMGLLGLYLIKFTFISSLAPSSSSSLDLSTFDYIFSFCIKFFVIIVLTWILNKVMPLLDKPRKRVLFIFFLGTIFSLYSELDLFRSAEEFSWSLLVVVYESISWLVTAYVLSRFIKPKHLGAL